MTQSITGIDTYEIRHAELDYPRAIMQIRAKAFEAGRKAKAEELKEKMGGMICPRCSAVVILPDGYKRTLPQRRGK